MSLSDFRSSDGVLSGGTILLTQHNGHPDFIRPQFSLRWYLSIAFSIVLHGLLIVRFGGMEASYSTDSLVYESPVISFVTLESIAEQDSAKTETPIEETDEFPEEIAPVKKENAPPKEQKQVVEKPQAESIASSSNNRPSVSDGMIEMESKRYFSELLAHIEKHKWYPKAARRRGIEGDVQVSFTLLPDGTIDGLQVTNNKEILTDAVRDAVNEALPMPTPPSSIHCPMPCEFNMRFSLNEG